MDQIAFLKQRKELTDAEDTAGLASLEREVLIHAQEFLNGEIGVETDTAPLFHSLFKTFSQTENADLKAACEKALEKVQPYLDDFDRENGLTRLDDLDKSVIEHNLTALSVYERINPFEIRKGDQLKYPLFSDLFRLTNNIEITDTDDQKSDLAHERFVDTLIEAARLQTFMKLSLHTEKITQDFYLSDLRQNMEVGLVSMFVIDRIPSGKPINDETKDFLHSEYQKLLSSI